MSLEHKKQARKAEAGLGSRVKPTGETNEALRMAGIAKAAERTETGGKDACAAGDGSIFLPKLFS